MATTAILGGKILAADGSWRDGALTFDGPLIASVGGVGEAATEWNAEGLLVLPGIIDLHGDAHERQMMPRPGVHFSHASALMETDRHIVANGITTAYMGLTYSWEPGLRGPEAARAFLAALEGMKAKLGADLRLHLRFETYNLDAEEEIAGWLREGRIDLLAFNDHMLSITEKLDQPTKVAVYAGRAGLTNDAFKDLALRTAERADRVPACIERLAAVARGMGVPMASHDDESPQDRAWFDAIGCRICEFPVDAKTARHSMDNGDPVILGAPNIMRGGSHCGRMGAQQAAGDGLCSVLTSDYYYPTMIQAAFKLAADCTLSLEKAWPLIAANPAAAVGLTDRGVLEPGNRGDVILVDATDPSLPRVVATFVAGRAVHLAADPSALLTKVSKPGLTRAAE